MTRHQLYLANGTPFGAPPPDESPAQTVVRLRMQEAAYQTALGTLHQTTQQSLLEFLG
jgi:hypothetical protein